MADYYREVRADFDVTVYDTIDQRTEEVPMMVNLWELVGRMINSLLLWFGLS